MAKGQITPRRFFLFLLGLTGVFTIVFVYFLSITLWANSQADPLSKSEKSMRAVGKAYVQLGYYELKEFYLTLTADEAKRTKLAKELDSIWAQIEANVALYQKHTILPQSTKKPLINQLQIYHTSSLARRKLLGTGRAKDALKELAAKEHQQAFFKREEIFNDIGYLLPHEAKKLLNSEKLTYTNGVKGMANVGWWVFIISIAVFFAIQLTFEAPDRKLLIKRLLPLFVLVNVVFQGAILFKPAPRYDAKYQLIKDYNRFINFMSYFNHYTKLEFQHVLDSSSLVKKQIEEEMAVYHRSVRQALRDSRKMHQQKFKKEVTILRMLRAKYFTTLRIPALVYSFRNENLAALRLLMPKGHLADSTLEGLDPESVIYNEGQNAELIGDFHQIFNEILARLDTYYEVAAKKLSQKNRFREAYWVGAGVLIVWLLWLFWRFRKPKRWVLHQARKHFLIEK